MLLETSARSIEVRAMQSVYKYIIKLENMPDHRLQKLAWSIGTKNE